MPLFKYFSEERFARTFMKNGEMRFGSLSYFRGIEDGGIRGDPKDGTLHYAPAEGIEITRVADGSKLTGVSFTTAAEAMFVYCASNSLSVEQADQFGAWCVEVNDIDLIVSRLAARAHHTSKLDYANLSHGAVDYRSLETIPGVDWAIPVRVALIKPPEYVGQDEYRIVLPLKAGRASNSDLVLMHIGNIEGGTKLHHF